MPTRIPPKIDINFLDFEEHSSVVCFVDDLREEFKRLCANRQNLVKKIWPKEAIRKMGELGFLGMMVNSKWGGGGIDAVSYAIAMEEIARVDASSAVIMSVNNSLVCYLLEKYGSDFTVSEK